MEICKSVDVIVLFVCKNSGFNQYIVVRSMAAWWFASAYSFIDRCRIAVCVVECANLFIILHTSSSSNIHRNLAMALRDVGGTHGDAR